MRSTLSPRVESFAVSDGVLLLPIGQGTQLDRLVSALADAICTDPDQWGAAIAERVDLAKVLNPVTTISMVRDGYGDLEDQLRILTAIRAGSVPGSWLHTEAGRLLAGMARDLQTEDVEAAQRGGALS